MITRQTDRLNNKILHQTGRKVLIADNISKLNMDSSSDVMNELKISSDISHAFEIYNLDGLETEREFNEGVGIISELSKKYRDIHVDLRVRLGKDYAIHYPYYDEISKELITYMKNDKSKLRESVKNAQTSEKFNQKEILRIEVDILEQKIFQVNIYIIQDIEEINKYINTMEEFINKYFEAINDINQDIKMAKLLKLKISEVARKKLGKIHEREQWGRLVKAENLQSEISYRFNLVNRNCEINLNDLNDYQLLELNRNRNLENEFNEIFDKIAILASMVPKGGDKAENILKLTCEKRKKN